MDPVPAILAAIPPDLDRREVALALLLAGTLLLAESDPETAASLAAVMESGALRQGAAI